MPDILTILAESFWFMLPAGVANMMPVIAAHYDWFPALNRPLDGGATFRGRRMLGKNKTIRGLIFGIIFGSIAGYLQHLAFIHWPWVQAISLIPYTAAIGTGIGAALGLGALLGDAIKSFFKRQRGLAPGQSWPIIDQADATLGALIVGALFIPLTLWHVITIVIIATLATYVVSFIGFMLHIKKSI